MALVRLGTILLCLATAVRSCSPPGSTCSSNAGCCSGNCNVYNVCGCGPQCVSDADCCGGGISCVNGSCNCSPLPGDPCGDKGYCCSNSGCVRSTMQCAPKCSIAGASCKQMAPVCAKFGPGITPCCNKNGICSCGIAAIPYCAT